MQFTFLLIYNVVIFNLFGKMSSAKSSNQLAASSSSSINSTGSSINTKNRQTTNFIEKNKNLSRFKSGSNKYPTENTNSIVIKYLNDVDNKKPNLKATYNVQTKANDQDDNQIADIIIESVAIVNDQGPTEVDISIISNHSSIVTESKKKLCSDFFIKPVQEKTEFFLPQIHKEQFKQVDSEMFDTQQDNKMENILRTSENCDLLRSVLFTYENKQSPIISFSDQNEKNHRAFTPPVNDKTEFVLEQGNQYQDSFQKYEKELSKLLEESQDNADVNISQYNAEKSKIRSEFLQK